MPTAFPGTARAGVSVSRRHPVCVPVCVIDEIPVLLLSATPHHANDQVCVGAPSLQSCIPLSES